MGDAKQEFPEPGAGEFLAFFSPKLIGNESKSVTYKSYLNETELFNLLFMFRK
jgi:hypothetical protein